MRRPNPAPPRAGGVAEHVRNAKGTTGYKQASLAQMRLLQGPPAPLGLRDPAWDRSTGTVQSGRTSYGRNGQPIRPSKLGSVVSGRRKALDRTYRTLRSR